LRSAITPSGGERVAQCLRWQKRDYPCRLADGARRFRSCIAITRRKYEDEVQLEASWLRCMVRRWDGDHVPLDVCLAWTRSWNSGWSRHRMRRSRGIGSAASMNSDVSDETVASVPSHRHPQTLWRRPQRRDRGRGSRTSRRLEDLIDAQSGEPHAIVVVTDNGSCYRARVPPLHRLPPGLRARPHPPPDRRKRVARPRNRLGSDGVPGIWG
jgi:hypothetical protein